MRRFQLREKIFALGDDFTIKDERGEDVYAVDGKVFTLRDTLYLNDMAGNRLATIRRRLLSLGRVYEIRCGEAVTVVHKHLFTFFRAKFTVDVPGPGDLLAAGNFLDYEYDFTDGAGQRVATVSRRWFSLTDTYGIEIDDEQDEVMILAACVVIDRCCHERD